MPTSKTERTTMKDIKNFADLKGHTLAACFKTGDDGELHFVLTDGRQFKIYNSQSCCESVSIESVRGDLADLVGEPLLMAEEVDNGPLPPGHKPSDYDSETWTFYKLATRKGYVDVRWFGTSNGDYRESV